MVEAGVRDEARRQRRLIGATFALLLALLALTMAAGSVDLGWGNVVANLAIATAKAGLILWVFMHLREATPLLRLFALGAVVWLGFLIALGLGDWMARTGFPEDRQYPAAPSLEHGRATPARSR